MASLGQRIRERRKEKRITLTQLSRQTGFSTGYLSQVERDMANPSMAVLIKVADALGTHIGFFFDEVWRVEAEGNGAVVRRAERKKLIYPAGNYENELLSPSPNSSMQFLWLNAGPGASSGERSYSHAGEECGLILKGKMEFVIGEESHVLEEGDSIYLRSTIPHRWRNVGDDELKAVWVVTPPRIMLPD